MDDADLARRARRGDDRSFTTLVRHHERSLYATAYSMTHSGWDAADAVQDALTEAYTNIKSLRDPAKFGPWVTKILINKCNAQLRKRNRVIPMDEPPEPQTYVWSGTDRELDLMNAVRRLSEDHREVIALRYFRDMKVDDIAALLGCPAGTVKSRINRALGELGVALGRPVDQEVPQ